MNEFVVTRLFDAPREMVYKAWTEVEHYVKWWGPRGFTTPACEIDLRVGGKTLICMRSPEGQDFWSGGVYKAIDPPARLRLTTYFADKDGNPVSPTEYGMRAEWPAESIFDITFEDLDGKTRLTIRQEGVDTALAESVGAVAGWNESLDKLAAYLGGQA